MIINYNPLLINQPTEPKELHSKQNPRHGFVPQPIKTPRQNGIREEKNKKKKKLSK